MGRTAEAWETLAEQRADEVCRALVRLGVMTHAQVARLLNVHGQIATDLVRNMWDQFEVQRKVPKNITKGRYVVPGNRLMSLVRLNRDVMAQWAAREQLARTRNHVPSDVLAQTLNLVELLIRLRHDGLIYDKWDIMLPQNGDEGLHAWLVKKGEKGEEDFKIGLFLLPMKLTPAEQSKKGMIFHGTLRRVIQHSTVKNTLFLATREYYETALRPLSTIEIIGRHFYLLPWESFKAHPGWYLDAIVRGDHIQRKALVDDTIDWEDSLMVPVQHRFAALLGFDDGRYRFVDTYVDGSIDRVRNWRTFTLGYQVPKTAAVAGADVYVFDETMRDGLEKLLSMKDRKTHESSIVEVHPWPDGMIRPTESTKTVVERRPATPPADELFDEPLTLEDMDEEDWPDYFMDLGDLDNPDDDH
ncbi:MAG: hypothetical protein K6T81_12605 [Alicyclobacillus macrosporangiidus]|uniref:hypothetical protein n=1 Tax=Alicyclobacillus macrosporangiidus TaxID=392015 RepID=UPI0026F27E92|nr:hypothetical protein [Alicyclobacillus macrosporangiidus]MCL6599564.1 hypothetical protein [Alicyclobacillus macrosporangiidus]